MTKMNFYLIIRSLKNKGAYKLIGYSVLFITIIYGVFQFQLITLNEQFIFEKKTEKKTEKKINKISLPSQIVKREKSNNTLSLQSMSLPTPPLAASTEPLKKPKELSEQTSVLLLNQTDEKQFEHYRVEPIKVERIQKEPIKKELATKKVTKNQHERVELKKRHINKNTHTTIHTTTNTRKNTKRIYQQLTSQSDVNVELAWPIQQDHYQKVLAYFEQCLGIGFGLIQTDELYVLSPLKNKAVMSSWLREVNGKLTVNEQRLLINQPSFNQLSINQSSLNEPLTSKSLLAQSAQEQVVKQVRLFPQSFDLRLAQLISQNLVIEQKQQIGKKLNSLESFFARFQLNKQQGSQSLTLVDIAINNTQIKNTWLLHQSACQ